MRQIARILMIAMFALVPFTGAALAQEGGERKCGNEFAAYGMEGVDLEDRLVADGIEIGARPTEESGQAGYNQGTGGCSQPRDQDGPRNGRHPNANRVPRPSCIRTSIIRNDRSIASCWTVTSCVAAPSRPFCAPR